MFNRKKEAVYKSIDRVSNQICCLPETHLDQGNLSISASSLALWRAWLWRPQGLLPGVRVCLLISVQIVLAISPNSPPSWVYRVLSRIYKVSMPVIPQIWSVLLRVNMSKINFELQCSSLKVRIMKQMCPSTGISSWFHYNDLVGYILMEKYSVVETMPQRSKGGWGQQEI